MFRLVVPIVLLGVAVGLFVTYTNPTYKSLTDLRSTYSAYNEALANSKKLLDIRNDLTTRYNAISAEDRQKIETMLPDNVDNIRFILDIEEISRPYGQTMRPRDVKYDPNAQDTATKKTAQATPGQIEAQNRNYGEFELEFSSTGNYSSFVSFLRDLEKNLRIVDITSITFASPDTGTVAATGQYKYNFKVKTYWLKN